MIMNDIDKSKLADALIADAVADIGALYDLDLTKEEIISCVDMILKLQKISRRIRNEMKFEYESIM